MPKKKKKDSTPLKKKHLLMLQLQELDENLRSATNQRDGLAAKLATLAAGYQDLESDNKDLVTRHSSLVAAFKQLESKNSSLVTSERCLTSERDTLTAKLTTLATGCQDLEAKNKNLVNLYSSIVTTEKCVIAERDTLMNKLAALEKTHQELAENLAQETRLLRIQLVGLQAELELLHDEAKAHKAALLADSAGTFTAKSVFMDNPVLNAPHLHLDFVLSGVELCAEQLGELHARMVDHHGRAGLLIFHDTIPEKLLANRRVDGQEEGRAFTLVVPEDSHGSIFLTSCSAFEFLMFRGAAEILSSHLARESAADRAHLSHWRHVAKHFLSLLSAGKSNQFKCDLHEWTVASDTGHVSSRLSRTSCAGCYVPGISVTITDTALIFSIPPGQMPLPMAAWPRTESGAPALQAELTIDTPRNGQSPWWLQAPHTDRLVLHELLGFLAREWQQGADRHPLHKRHLKNAYSNCSKLRSRLARLN